ncbi:MAG: DNA polymerase domain-containing protein [Fervidicoccaceae archaeon]
MSRNWTLKADFLNGKIKLLQIDSEGRLIEKEIKASYPFFLMPIDRTPEELEQILIQIPFVKGTYIESWLVPPWYNSEQKVVRAEVECAPCFLKIAKRFEGIIARRVNVQPSSKSLVLEKMRLPLFHWEGEDPWDIELDPPSIRVLHVKGKAGKILLISSYIIDEDGKSNEDSAKIEVGRAKAELPEELVKEHHIVTIEGTGFSCEGVRAPICLERKGNPVEDLVGLMELSRLSYTNLRETAERSIGHILTEIEALEAIKRKMMVPPFRHRSEKWRTMEEFLEADNGGLIGLPKPGIYENVVQLDFSSLYPSIIAKFNISPETVDRPFCSNESFPPGSLHGVCLDSEGLVSSVLRELVARRERLKAEGNWLNSRREKALKWIMVASFGYLGYRNSRFGSLAAYESVVSISREIMRRAIMTSVEMGYRVIHFIVDSLFLWKHGREIYETDIAELRKKIEMETKMRIKVEAIYSFLIFPMTATKNIGGAPNRYYGITKEGKIVIKGVKCPEIEGILIPRGKEKPIIELLISNKHPRKLCPQLSFAIRNLL